MVRVADEVCIDAYEASLVDLDGDAPFPFSDPVGAARVRAVSEPGRRAQVNVTEIEAEIACENSGKRLCNRKEWILACSGSEGRAFPYGNGYVAGACNDARNRPQGAGADLTEPRLAREPGTSAPTGSFARCKTPEGVFDLHGNVHEWVRDASHGGDARYGMFLGGYFADAKLNGRGCAYKTTAHFKAYRDYSIGFRCCADPKKAVP
ncbi:MAG: SUMF1/EgtB/PvdO family nonheme iron enzyme [Polyangiaceae bacterium]